MRNAAEERKRPHWTNPTRYVVNSVSAENGGETEPCDSCKQPRPVNRVVREEYLPANCSGKGCLGKVCVWGDRHEPEWRPQEYTLRLCDGCTAVYMAMSEAVAA